MENSLEISKCAICNKLPNITEYSNTDWSATCTKCGCGTSASSMELLIKSWNKIQEIKLKHLKNN